jgi:hypothetical protein
MAMFDAMQTPFAFFDNSWPSECLNPMSYSATPLAIATATIAPLTSFADRHFGG